MGSWRSELPLHTEYDSCLGESPCRTVEASSDVDTSSFMKHSFYLKEWNAILPERMTDKQAMVIQTGVSDRYFFENEQSKPLISKETVTVFAANDKMWAFKQKLELCKTCIHHPELDSSWIIEDFSSKTGSNVMQLDFVML